MKTLPTQFKRNDWYYTQLDRIHDVALYAKRRHDRSALNYEVIVVQHQPIVQWPAGTITEEHEKYPAPEQWGTYDFTFSGASHRRPLEDARERMIALAAKGSAKGASLSASNVNIADQQSGSPAK
jgi:hypothetical protein